MRTMLESKGRASAMAASGLIGLLGVIAAGCAEEQMPAPATPATAAGAPGAAAAPGGQTPGAPAATAPPVDIGGAKWHFYDGNGAPTAAGLKEGGGEGAGTAATFTKVNGDGTVTFDTGDPGNKATWVRAPAVESGSPKEFTFVTRLKADDTSERGFDFEFRFGDAKAQGPRVKFIVKPNEIQIEKPDGASGSTRKFKLDGNAYHTFQLSFVTTPQKVTTNVYVDGSDGPVLTVEGTQLVGDNRMAFGDMGSNSCKGTIDWMAWTEAGAFKPSALRGKLPDDLGDLTAYK